MTLEARAKAVNFLLELDPETLDDFFESVPLGDSGDYETRWNAQKLKDHFQLTTEYEDSPRAKLINEVEKMYWEFVIEKDKLATFQELVKRLLNQIEVDEINKASNSEFDLLKGWVKWNPFKK